MDDLSRGLGPFVLRIALSNTGKKDSPIGRILFPSQCYKAVAEPFFGTREMKFDQLEGQDIGRVTAIFAVQYESSVDDKVHTTCFVFDVLRYDEVTANELGYFYLHESTIHADDLIVEEAMGGFADDGAPYGASLAPAPPPTGRPLPT